MRSCLRFPGGKTRAVKYLKDFIPKGTKELVSPFLGGGSFELYCASELGIRVYAADIFIPLVYFWNHLLYDTSELKRRVSSYLPLVTKEKYTLMQNKLQSLENTIDIATHFFVLNRCSFSGNIAGGFTPYGISKTGRNPRFNSTIVDRLDMYVSINERFYVELSSFEDTLNKYESKIFTYLDPPYIIKDKIYGAKQDRLHMINHTKLRDILKRRKGPWLLSYNNCDKVKELYEGFSIIEDIEWRYGMSKDKTSKELLILSPKLEKLLKR